MSTKLSTFFDLTHNYYFLVSPIKKLNLKLNFLVISLNDMVSNFRPLDDLIIFPETQPNEDDSVPQKFPNKSEKQSNRLLLGQNRLLYSAKQLIAREVITSTLLLYLSIIFINLSLINPILIECSIVRNK